MIIGSDIFIITVPTPVSTSKVPVTNALESASALVGNAISKDSSKVSREIYVIYESTVYPGLTEDICKPIVIENARKSIHC